MTLWALAEWLWNLQLDEDYSFATEKSWDELNPSTRAHWFEQAKIAINIGKMERREKK